MFSFCKVNNDNCIQIIMITILGLTGYIIIIIGIMSICFQKVFELFNLKLNNINKLLLDLQVKKRKKCKGKCKGKCKFKDLPNEIDVFV